MLSQDRPPLPGPVAKRLSSPTQQPQAAPARGASILVRTGYGVFGVLLLAVAWLVPVFPAGTGQFTVVFAVGGGQLRSADGATTALRDSMAVRQGDRIEMPAGARATLAVADGHKITVGESSIVEISISRRSLLGTAYRNQVAVRSGEARMGGVGRARSSMSVGLPNGTAGVRGTTFDVVVQGENASISLLDGSVTLKDIPSGEIALKSGDGVVVTKSRADVSPVPAAPVVTPIPAGQEIVHTPGVLFRWEGGTTRYRVEIATDSAFLQVRESMDTAGGFISIPVLDVTTPVYLRVRSVLETGLRGYPSEAVTVQMANRWAKGLALREANQLEPSLAELEAERARFPRNAALLRDIGWTYYLLGRHAEARTVYEQGRAITPDDRDLLVELGRVYFWLKESALAEETYRGVLARQPNDAMALWGLGDLYRVLGRTREATPLVRRALKADPAHPYARETLKLLQRGG